jgi:hypothetical protein
MWGTVLAGLGFGDGLGLGFGWTMGSAHPLVKLCQNHAAPIP